MPESEDSSMNKCCFLYLALTRWFFLVINQVGFVERIKDSTANIELVNRPEVIEGGTCSSPLSRYIRQIESMD